MNQIPIYQHPFVDVFKTAKLTEWQTAQKEGDVTEVYDKILAKNVIKVAGVTPASNYFQLPAQKYLPKQALGLIGKYVYSIVNVPAGKTFVIHFDYTVNETRLVRVSVSNIYKEFKNLNGTSIQLPVGESLQYGKWTVLCINGWQVLEENHAFTACQKASFHMRSIQVTANVQVRGIYTSDIKYSVQTLPKEMALKILKGQDWFSQYAWIEYPLTEEGFSQDQKFQKENASSNTSSKQGLKAKKVKFSEKEKQPIVIVSEEEKVSFPTITSGELEPAQHKVEQIIEKTVRDIEDIKNHYQLGIEEKHLHPRAEVTFFYDQDSTMYPKPMGKVARTLSKDEAFVLKPNPIMKLERSIGFHPKYTSGSVFFNKDQKLSREVLYTQANMLFGYQPSNQRQRLFYDRPQLGTIEHLHVDGNFAFTVSRGGEDKDFEVIIWDVQDANIIFSFKPPLSSLLSISLNEKQQSDWYLCICGKDFQRRDLVLVYNFSEMIVSRKVDIYARQLCDFDLVNMRFNDAVANGLVACGRESIRLLKIKNGHLPGQMVTLNQTGRGKVFTRSLVDYTVNEKGQKKPVTVFITSTCGLLYLVNYQSRQVDKIIQIHEDKVTALLMSPERNFIATASVNGFLRLWSPDFSKLVSEVNTQQQIVSCDVNHKEIVVLGQGGTISILDMEESTFSVVVRSHLDHVSDLCFNSASGGKLVSVSIDQKIYIWNSENMEVQTEFTTQNDTATKLATSHVDPTVAVGFKSGFIRIFDLSVEATGKLVAETMIFDSPVSDLQYSPENKYLAVFYKCCRIVIFSIEKGYQPVKNIDYEFPNENYFSLAFSPDDKLLANISSNANNVTIWETKNFSLKYHLDLTGDIVSKIQFAPNGKDVVALTTSSKLKFYRISSTFASELQFNKDIYGVTDLECVDFAISPNCKYIAVCGREGVVKIFDYFMRGAAVPSCQAFQGHFRHPRRLYWSTDMRFLFTVGDCNGIFRWSFFGDRNMPLDMSKHYEELEPAHPLLKVEPGEPTFNHDALLKQTNAQIDDQIAKLSEEFGKIGEAQQVSVPVSTPPVLASRRGPTIEYNQSGYRFEQYDIELKKVLQCSIGDDVKNNLVWNKDLRYVAYTSQNIVIVEDLNQEKTQRLLREGNDKLYQLKLSPNGRLLLGFTREGRLDGLPNIFVWEATTLKKLNQIALSDQVLEAVEFSSNSNMLLVISKTYAEGGVVSQVAAWDFLDGHRDILCKSYLPLDVLDGRWNFYLGSECNEFVTIADRKYHFWRISGNLALQYQEGDVPKGKDLFASLDDRFTACEFLVPTPEQVSVYMLLGLSNGNVWVVDTRCNQFLYSVKLLEGAGIRHLRPSRSRIIVEGTGDSRVHCWPQGAYDMSDPQSFFLDKEQTLSLDGFMQASSYEEACAECILSTSSGTLWYLSWADAATIKIKSCHSPTAAIGASDFKYLSPGQFRVAEGTPQFDQNYLVASSGEDGVIKLWNMYDSEFQLQFVVPKEQCLDVALHQFKPYLLASYTDGFLRFFSLEGKTLGRLQTTGDLVDPLVALRILPNGNHVLAASRNGQIVLIHVQQWEPLAVKLEPLASVNTTVSSFDVSFLEPYNKWLVGTASGKVIVYNRKDFNAYHQELFDEHVPTRFNYMDTFNLLDYVDNGFTESKRSNTLDHFYSVSKRSLVKNEVEDGNMTTGVFCSGDLTLHLTFIAKAPYIFMRNFELHQVVKRIGLSNLPLQLAVAPTTTFLYVLQADGVLKMVDQVNTDNASEVGTIHEEARVLRLCPNGRYVLTGGSKGDVCIWHVFRR